jgi:hypothetical protein
MKPIVVVPAAGKSFRFLGNAPKWMRTHPDGSLMIEKALKTFQSKNFKTYIITTEEINEKFQIIVKLSQALPDLEVILLNKQTSSSIETLVKGLEKFGNNIDLNSPLFIKDVDNFVEFDWNFFDFSVSSSVGVDLKTMPINNIINKSFLIVNENNMIVDFIEKEVVSNIISVGTHYFKSAFEAIRTAQLLLNKKKNIDLELYTSHIIAYNIYSGIEYKLIKANIYEDYGTQTEWNIVRNKHKTLFIDFDGILVENVGRYGNKNWFTRNDTIIERNINAIKKLYNEGAQIIITTSRDVSEKEYLRNFLITYGIIPFDIICGLNHSERIIINDYFDTNPYPTASAINIERNGDLSFFLNY